MAKIIATPKINLSEVEKTCENGVTWNNEKKL
jgi:NifB/MoaA-like Fe-S oxidoreductase